MSSERSSWGEIRSLNLSEALSIVREFVARQIDPFSDLAPRERGAIEHVVCYAESCYRTRPRVGKHKMKGGGKEWV